MPRVFVVHEPKPNNSGRMYDVMPALKHGQIVYVFEKDFSPTRNARRAVEVATEVLDTMTADDFVVWAGGDPFGLYLVGMIAGDRLNQANWLYWDRVREDGAPTGRGEYLPLSAQVFEE